MLSYNVYYRNIISPPYILKYTKSSRQDRCVLFPLNADTHISWVLPENVGYQLVLKMTCGRLISNIWEM